MSTPRTDTPSTFNGFKYGFHVHQLFVAAAVNCELPGRSAEFLWSSRQVCFKTFRQIQLQVWTQVRKHESSHEVTFALGAAFFIAPSNPDQTPLQLLRGVSIYSPTACSDSQMTCRSIHVSNTIRSVAVRSRSRENTAVLYVHRAARADWKSQHREAGGFSN